MEFYAKFEITVFILSVFVAASGMNTEPKKLFVDEMPLLLFEQNIIPAFEFETSDASDAEVEFIL